MKGNRALRTIEEINIDLAFATKSLQKLKDAREAEGRAFTTDEKAQIAQYMSEIERLQGELKEIRETESIESGINAKVDSVSRPNQRQLPGMPPDNDGDRYAIATKFEIPVRAHVPRNLRCFKESGKGSAREASDAYKFGVMMAARHFDAPWAKQRMKELASNDRAMNEGNNSQGGAYVPDEFASYIIRNVEEYGVFINEARVIPMTSDLVTIPRRTAGATVYNVGEGVAITDSTPTADNVTLTAKKLGVLVYYSREISEDAIISVADYLADEMALAAAQKLDEVGFDGDGSNADFGILGLVPKLEALASTDWAQARVVPINTFAEITAASLGKIQGQVGTFAKPNGKFYCSPSAAAVGIGGVLQGMGGVTIAEAAGRLPMQFNGYPVVQSHYLREESSGSVADDDVMVIFGDLKKAATLGLRRSFEIAESREIKFLEDQIALRGTLRFDINIHDLGGAISDGHTAKGPLCALMADAA